MKKISLLLAFLCISAIVTSQQIRYSISGVTNKKIMTLGPSGFTIAVGTRIHLTELSNDDVYKGYIIKYDENIVNIPLSDIKKISFDKPQTTNELWQSIRLNSDADESFSSKGFQYDLRKDLEDETFDAIQNLDKCYGFFYDGYLEDYIQGLLYKIHPITLNDGRPGSLSVKILKNSAPNAFCMPTGTIIITTGLLSTIRSEDEFIGILAHEVAHFELDHQIVNINKSITRQKRADFWVGFSTAVAAASEAYLSTKYNYPPSGILTLSTAVLSNSIASSINERVGSNFNIDQESEADNASTMVLSYFGKDPKALSAALSRIRDYCTLNGDYLALSGTGTYPALSSRILKIGKVDPNSFNNPKYDQIISLVNTYNSMSEYGLQHLETSMNLSNRNIDAGVGTEDDYLIKAMSIRLLYNTPEKNQEALDLINKAKVLNISPHDYIYKQEGLTLIRLGRPKEAGEAFKTYLNNLVMGKDNSSYVQDEIDWTQKMIFKVSVF